MNAKQFNPPYGTHYAIREMARKLNTNMSTIKQIIVVIAIIVVTAIVVGAQGNVPSQHTWGGECEFRGEIMVCITATEQ